MTDFDNKTESFEEGQKKKRLILRLTEKQAENLKNGTIGLTGLGLGATGTGMYFLFGSNTLSKNQESSSIGTSINDEVTTYNVETELPLADVSDRLSFKDAFAEARAEVGAGGFFEWRGNTYNTYYKEEWEGMSDLEKEEYLTSVEKATDVTNPERHTSENEVGFSETMNDIPELDIAEVDDSLSFKDAFADAREQVGAGGIFEWRGKAYNTYHREEWQSMSDSEKEEYLASVKITAKENDIELDDPENYKIASKSHKEETDVDQGLEEAESDGLPELEPVVGISDLNGDGIIDAIAVDIDRDGYADVFAVDVNEDGFADGIALNETGDENLDVLIIDEGQDGFDDHVYVEKTEGIVSMDDFIIVDDDEGEIFAEDHDDIEDDNSEFSNFDDFDQDEIVGPEI